jgi:hypothetical protein
MKFTEEQLMQVQEFAALLFTPAEILIILDLAAQPCDEFCTLLTTPEFTKAFDRGRLLTEAKVRKSILDLAAQGSGPAQMLADKMIERSRLHSI